MSLKRIYFWCFLFFYTFNYLKGQSLIKGQVTDASGPLIGATIQVKGSDIGTVTDFNGQYSLELQPGDWTIEIQYLGYETWIGHINLSKDQTLTQNVILVPGIGLEEIIVIGTRAGNRTHTQSAVPVDVINVAQLMTSGPQTSLNEILTFSAPSFSSNTQTISDGTDHIDPASLRGLGPDQVLVLVNQKRRHATSLINVNGTFGRGNVGTDMNAIPASAIQSIQVLRDGAAAQYGSDAIAGVINVRLKQTVNQLDINLTTGGNFTQSSHIGSFEGQKKKVDGSKVNLGINYGLPIGSNGGFINLTGEFDYRDWSNRMLSHEGQIFIALNAIERVALDKGYDISQVTNQQIQELAQIGVGHSSNLMTQINQTKDLTNLQKLLATDVTKDELTMRNQDRSHYNMRVGQSAGRGGKFFTNLSIPLGENLIWYSFGGISYRHGNSGCFYRLPFQERTLTSIFTHGITPKINSHIVDQSISTGIQGSIQHWSVDFSNTYGQNSFQYEISDTYNATLGPSSPTIFDSGGHTFIQNTANIDLSRYIETDQHINGLNLAFGAEFRYENYQLIPGTELSWGNYDRQGNLVTSTTPDTSLTRDILGRIRPSGCQCFAGFLPSNQIDARRTSLAGYTDVEVDLSKRIMVGAALRFENYSDFGSTFNWKLSSRWTLNDIINIRAAVATGFRAPSLHQISYSRTSTLITTKEGQTIIQEVGVFNNSSRAAKLLGIPSLKEETAQSYSAGITANLSQPNLKITLDGYMVNIKDRVILTGNFSPGQDEDLQRIFQSAQAEVAAFFANAINTESIGLDLVISHQYQFHKKTQINTDLAFTLSQTKAKRDPKGNIIIHASDLLREKGLVENYFDQSARIYLEETVPLTKVILSHHITFQKWSGLLRNTLFGSTTEANNETHPATYAPKLITDITLGYEISKELQLSVGSNNLFDLYPDRAKVEDNSDGRFIYSRTSPQFSLNGRYLFARIQWKIK